MNYRAVAFSTVWLLTISSLGINAAGQDADINMDSADEAITAQEDATTNIEPLPINIWGYGIAALVLILSLYFLGRSGRNLARFIQDELATNDNERNIRDQRLLHHVGMLAVCLLVFVILLWGVVGLLPAVKFGIPPNSNEVGDAFGVANTLFSGLAFGGVILALFLQTIELRYQRRELNDTREEFQKQTDVFFKTTFLDAMNTLAMNYASMRVNAPRYILDRHDRIMAELTVLVEALRPRITELNDADDKIAEMMDANRHRQVRSELWDLKFHYVSRFKVSGNFTNLQQQEDLKRHAIALNAELVRLRDLISPIVDAGRLPFALPLSEHIRHIFEHSIGIEQHQPEGSDDASKTIRKRVEVLHDVLTSPIPTEAGG